LILRVSRTKQYKESLSLWKDADLGIEKDERKRLAGLKGQ